MRINLVGKFRDSLLGRSRCLDRHIGRCDVLASKGSHILRCWLHKLMELKRLNENLVILLQRTYFLDI